LAPDRTPPSTYRHSPTVAGGHTPGTAQLAATASTRSTPLRGVKTTTSPVAASTAGIRTSRAGQAATGRRASIAVRRTASVTVSAARANAPTRRCRSASSVAGPIAAAYRAMKSTRSNST